MEGIDKSNEVRGEASSLEVNRLPLCVIIGYERYGGHCWRRRSSWHSRNHLPRAEYVLFSPSERLAFVSHNPGLIVFGGVVATVVFAATVSVFAPSA